ncbi:MAG: META domain-containing protein [Deinococcus sp.]
MKLRLRWLLAPALGLASLPAWAGVVGVRVPASVRPSQPVIAVSPPLGVTWELRQLRDGGRPLLIVPTLRPTLRFGGRQASGLTPCAPFQAGYASRSDILRFGALKRGQGVCTRGLKELEGRYLRGLKGVTRYQLDGPTLTLFAGPAKELVFRQQGR